jgi:hypothetical protein
MRDALQRVSSVQRLRALEAQGVIDARAFQRGVALTSAPATPEMWRRALRVYLVGLGIAMALSGVIFFFAFNWADFHRLGKLALVASGLVASASHAASQGLDTMRGKSAMLVATVLVGPFWVVFGQAYQTGADPWNLFALWAALTLPWVVGARFVGLWMLWLCIAVTALLLFWQQVVPRSWDLGPWLALALLFGGGWFAMVRGHASGRAWLGVRWARRVLASAYLGSLTISCAALVFDGATPARLLGLAIYVGTCFRLWQRQTSPERDVAILTAMAATVVALTTCALVKGIDGADFALMAFVLSITTGGQVAWMAKWLRGLHRGDVATPPSRGAS